MSRDEDEQGYDLYAFLGDRDPILRLAGHLPQSKFIDLGRGVYMIPLTEDVRQAAGILDGPQTSEWRFRTIDAVSASRCASLAGAGRIAYVEAWGYKDDGYELGIWWADGVRLGPVSEGWWGPGGGALTQIVAFLGVDFRGRQYGMEVLHLNRLHSTEEWAREAADGGLRRGPPPYEDDGTRPALAESIGLLTNAGFRPLLHDGTRLPTCCEERLSTVSDDQAAMHLVFVAGSLERHRQLAVFDIDVGVRAPRGVPRFLLRIGVAEDGTTEATATNQQSGVTQRCVLGRVAIRSEAQSTAGGQNGQQTVSAGLDCCRAPALSAAEEDLGSARGFEFMHATCAHCGAHWLKVFCVTTELSGMERIYDHEASEMLAAHGARLKTVMQAWADQHL
jgi:hypothetical protein